MESLIIFFCLLCIQDAPKLMFCLSQNLCPTDLTKKKKKKVLWEARIFFLLPIFITFPPSGPGVWDLGNGSYRQIWNLADSCISHLGLLWKVDVLVGPWNLVWLHFTAFSLCFSFCPLKVQSSIILLLTFSDFSFFISDWPPFLKKKKKRNTSTWAKVTALVLPHDFTQLSWFSH